MPFNGSGVFTRLYSWANDAAANIKIRADRMDNEMNGMATGLSQCITKDGQTTVTANLPMSGFRHTGVGDATSRNNYGSYAQIMDGKGLPTVGGTANAITLAYSIPHTAYVNGMEIAFVATAANTAAATVNVDGLGVRDLTKNGSTALASGDIANGELVFCKYDGTRFQVINDIAVGAGSVTNSMLASMAANTVKVNATNASASPTDLAIGASQTAARGATGDLRAMGFNELVALTTEATVASASTVDLGAQLAPVVNITGTTTITSFGTVAAGTMRRVVFGGALVLTHNGTSLILPGGANITTAAGDSGVFISLGSGNWRCVDFQYGSNIVTPWVAYTPVVNGCGAVTGLQAVSRRVGSNLEVRFRFVCGTTSGTTFDISIGFNGTNGGVTLSSTALLTGENLVGAIGRSVNNAPANTVLANSSANTVLRAGVCNAPSNAPMVPIPGNILCATGETIAGFASVPITGW